MTWSKFALNSIESTLRVYDFARHVADEIVADVEGRGIVGSKPYERKPEKTAIVLPQWSIIWFEKTAVIGDGATQVSTVNPGSAVTAKVGVVITCFWLGRRKDPDAVAKPPEVHLGLGDVSFEPWAAYPYKNYLQVLAEKVNADRAGRTAMTLQGRVGLLDLKTSFKWLEPLVLEDVKDATTLAAGVGRFGDAIAAL